MGVKESLNHQKMDSGFPSTFSWKFQGLAQAWHMDKKLPQNSTVKTEKNSEHFVLHAIWLVQGPNLYEWSHVQDNPVRTWDDWKVSGFRFPTLKVSCFVIHVLETRSLLDLEVAIRKAWHSLWCGHSLNVPVWPTTPCQESNVGAWRPKPSLWGALWEHCSPLCRSGWRCGRYQQRFLSPAQGRSWGVTVCNTNTATRLLVFLAATPPTNQFSNTFKPHMLHGMGIFTYISPCSCCHFSPFMYR